MRIEKILLNKEDMRYTVRFENGECKQYENSDAFPMEMIEFIANSEPDYLGNFYIMFNRK